MSTKTKGPGARLSIDDLETMDDIITRQSVGLWWLGHGPLSQGQCEDLFADRARLHAAIVAALGALDGTITSTRTAHAILTEAIGDGS